MTEPVRILFVSDAGAETLWARPADEGRYRVDSVPFCTPSVSRGDVVTAHDEDGLLRFDALYEKSGERTLWLRVREEGGLRSETGLWLLGLLAREGVAVERPSDDALAVSVSPSVDLEEALMLPLLSRDPSLLTCVDADPDPMHLLPVVPGSPAEAWREALERRVEEEFCALMALATAPTT